MRQPIVEDAKYSDKEVIKKKRGLFRKLLFFKIFCWGLSILFLCIGLFVVLTDGMAVNGVVRIILWIPVAVAFTMLPPIRLVLSKKIKFFNKELSFFLQIILFIALFIVYGRIQENIEIAPTKKILECADTVEQTFMQEYIGNYFEYRNDEDKSYYIVYFESEDRIIRYRISEGVNIYQYESEYSLLSDPESNYYIIEPNDDLEYVNIMSFIPADNGNFRLREIEGVDSGYFIPYSRDTELTDYKMITKKDFSTRENEIKAAKERYWHIKLRYLLSGSDFYIEEWWFDSIDKQIVTYRDYPESSGPDDPVVGRTWSMEKFNEFRILKGDFVSETVIESPARRIGDDYFHTSKTIFYPDGESILLFGGVINSQDSRFNMCPAKIGGKWSILEKKHSFSSFINKDGEEIKTEKK